MRKSLIAITVCILALGLVLLKENSIKPPMLEAANKLVSEKLRGKQVLDLISRAPASVPNANEPATPIVPNKISGLPQIDLTENTRREEQYRELASRRTKEWVDLYSSKKSEQWVGSYSLTHLDQLAAIPKSRFKGKSIDEQYAYAIVQGNRPSEVQVYLDQSQDKIVLLSGRASVKSNSQNLVLPQGAKVIYKAEATGIVHVQFKPGSDPIFGLSEIRRLNKSLKWANLEVIDRVERAQ